MKIKSIQSDLITQILSIFVFSLGIVFVGFFSNYFLQQPLIAWLVVLFTYFAKDLKNYIKNEFVYNIFKSFLEGAAFITFLVIFVLSTNGKTGLFGIIPQDQFVNFIQGISGFFAVIGVILVVLFCIFYILEKFKKFNIKFFANFFMILAIADFILLIINIGNVIPMLKPYDFILLLILFITFTVSFSLAKMVGNKS